MKTAYVYILKCSDNSYYTGVTNDIDRRLSEHQSEDFPGYTHSRRPVKLAWNSPELPIREAIALEKQIKGWRRAKKEALIRGDWEALPDLAQPYWKKGG